MIAYACTTNTCSERFAGFTDEPTFCSICEYDLTPMDVPPGETLASINATAAMAPRPLPEGDPDAHHP